MYLIHVNSESSAEVQLKIYWSIFDCAKEELLQIYFKGTYSLHMKTDIIQRSCNPHKNI